VIGVDIALKHSIFVLPGVFLHIGQDYLCIFGVIPRTSFFDLVGLKQIN
tara:strand:- start:768 stop:914 length:147 start_codon:yes stop_codon:yes gene_type:complete